MAIEVEAVRAASQDGRHELSIPPRDWLFSSLQVALHRSGGNAKSGTGSGPRGINPILQASQFFLDAHHACEQELIVLLVPLQNAVILPRTLPQLFNGASAPNERTAMLLEPCR